MNVEYAAIARYQDEKGAFRMWPDSEPSVWLTAYILRTLWVGSFQVRGWRQCAEQDAESGRKRDAAESLVDLGETNTAKGKYYSLRERNLSILTDRLISINFGALHSVRITQMNYY